MFAAQTISSVLAPQTRTQRPKTAKLDGILLGSAAGTTSWSHKDLFFDIWNHVLPPQSLQRWLWRWQSFAAFVLAFGSLAGCGNEDRVGREIAHRFIEQESIETFQRTDLFTLSSLETWSFDRPKDLEPWRQELFDRRFEQRGLNLVMLSSKRRPRLLRQVDWQADEVHALEVLLGGFSRGIGRIFWADDGEDFSDDRSLAARRADDVDPERLVFDLTFHPRWRGHIERLKIQFESTQKSPILLREILVSRFLPVAESVAAAASRSWKIDLDNEARNGFLALPGVPVDRRWQIPADATLRVGFAMGAGARRPVRFGAEIEVDGQGTQLLFEEVVEPISGGPATSEPEATAPATTAPATTAPAFERLPQGQWHDREISLAEFGGEMATVRLTVEPDDGPREDYDLIQGLSYWANPEVLRAAPRRSMRSPGSAPVNVVLISIDTLRSDHMSLYGYERLTTPKLDGWAARRATVFENAVASSPWTMPSHLTMFSGLDAMHHGFNHSGIVPDRFQLMAEELRQAGYNTLAVTGGGFMSPSQGFGQGFDRYQYWPEAQSEGEIEHGVGRALDWIDSVADQPFFLFFHTYEVHWPYRRRAPFFEQFMGPDVAAAPEVYIGISDDPREPEAGFLLSQKLFWKPEKRILERSPVTTAELPEIVGRYDSGIGFADLQVARLLDRFEAGDLSDRTLILITSDHGEALGERGLGGHAYLDEFNLMVPLLVSLPDGRGWGQRVHRQVRGTDLLPTVRQLVGLEHPAVDGRSLVPLIEDPSAAHPPEAWSYAAFSNRGIALRLDNRLKYRFNNTAWQPLVARDQLFDLQSDPAEELDLVSSERDVEGLRRRVREQMAAWTAIKLRVQFRNASPRPVSGRVRGAGIHPAIVKTLALPAKGLTWIKLGMAEFRMQPGEEFSFYLERVEGKRLRFEIDEPAGDPQSATDFFAADVDVETLTTDWEIAQTEGIWTSHPIDNAASSAAATAILVYRPQHVGPAEGAPTPTADPKILEQLEALGYVP